MTTVAEKDFKALAKKAKAKGGTVLYVKHEGEPKQYQTEHGTDTAYDGDYVVQVGEIEHTETIPPNKEKGIAGGVVTHKVPKLAVMKRSQFEDQYEI